MEFTSLFNQESVKGFLLLLGLLTAATIAMFLKTLAEGFIKMILSKKEKANGETYRRKGDEEANRLTSVIEKLNELLNDMNLTQKLMAEVLKNQSNWIQGAIDRQKEMALQLNQIHNKVVGGF